MLDATLLECLATPPDAPCAIVTQGPEAPHVVNSWNSYVQTTDDGKFLIPAGGMHRTENNVARNNGVKLTVGNREVMGKTYKGTGFLITGTAEFVTKGPEFEIIKARFPWARAALVITVLSAEQTL